MSTDNNQKFRDVVVAQFAPDMASAAQTIVDGLIADSFSYTGFCPDAGATTNSSVLLEYNLNGDMSVSKVVVSLTAAATVDNTNNATFSLVYNNGNGGADTTVATVTTNAAATGINGGNNAAKDTPYNVPITAANSLIPSGSSVYWKVTKGGAGGLAVTNGASFRVRGKPAV